MREPDPWLDPNEESIPWVDPVSPESQIPFADAVPPEDDSIPFVEEVPKIGFSILAWIWIIALVGLDILLTHWVPEQPDPGAKPPPDLDVFMLKFQGRYIVGANQLFGGGGKGANPLVANNGRELLDMAAAHNGSYEARLHFAILEGELDSANAAYNTLQAMVDPPDDTNEWKRLRKIRGILESLYEEYDAGQWDAPSVSPQEKQYLIDELGWFGRLATAPRMGENHRQRDTVLAEARSTVIGVVSTFLTILALMLIGLIGLIIFLIFAGIGKLRGGIRTGSRHGGVYAETFALWMLMFLVLMFAARHFLKGVVPDEDVMFFTGIIELFSLLVLGWPVLRGVSWQQVREDIGLSFGRSPFLEPFLGICTYILSLPLLGVGLLLVLLLKAIGLGGGKLVPFADGDPVHPIVFELPNAGGWQIFQVFFLACIVAPIVEEIMFRGVLYRQVREGTSPMGRFGSVFLGALVVSFIFAIIHPQGILGVPVLMALAFGFTLAREWRGTVIPGIIAHGINNGLALTAALFLLRS